MIDVDKIVNEALRTKKYSEDFFDLFSPESLGMPEAGNPIEFVLGKHFLNFDTIFPLQFQVLRDFFEVLCPYCNDVEEVQNCIGMSQEEMLSQTLLKNGICPKCGRSKLDIYKEKGLRFYNDLIGVAGVKSGKTTLGALMMASYILHKILFFRDIRKWLGILPTQSFHFVFLAASELQAKSTGWDYFSSVKELPWFKEYFKRIGERCRELGIRKDEVIEISDSSWKLKFAKIVLRPLHTNSGSIAGPAFMFVFIDEMSKIDRSTTKRGVDEIYRVSRNNQFAIRSAFKRRIDEGDLVRNGDIFDAVMVCASTPMFEDDKILELMSGAERLSRRFAFHMSSFEANPFLSREIIEEEDEEDPQRILRDYDAIPTSGVSNFVSKDSVSIAVLEKSPMLFSWRIEKEMKMDRVMIYPVLDNSVTDKLTIRFMHVDPGRVRDSFAIVLGRIEGDQEDYRVFIEAIVDISPKQFKGSGKVVEVDFDRVFEFIKKLCMRFSLVVISYDRWNSVSHIQRLRNLGMNVVEGNLKYSDFMVFRQDLNGKRILFPETEIPFEDILRHRLSELVGMPRAKAVKELLMLQDDGKKVTHPSSGSDDLIYCCVGVHKNAMRWLGMVEEKGVKSKLNMRNSFQERARGKVIRLRRFI